MASLLVVYQEVLHAATVMLISEIIALAPTIGRNEPTVVYGTASLLVVILEVLRVMTMLISVITARVLTRRMIEPTVVFGTVNPRVVFQEDLHVAMIMKRSIVSAEKMMARYIAGRVQFKYLVFTISQTYFNGFSIRPQISETERNTQASLVAA